MKWNDFLNPRSMLTPGIAGSVVMVIANTLWVEFMLPQRWTALILSFILIVPILVKYSACWFENVIYFTFNGLIVFALAVNTNFAGRKLHEISTPNNDTLVAQQLSNVFAMSSSTNIALTGNEIRLAHNNRDTAITNVQSDKEKNDADNEKDKKSKSKKNKLNPPKREFFQQWF